MTNERNAGGPAPLFFRPFILWARNSRYVSRLHYHAAIIHMAGVYYEAREELPDQWIVSKGVLRTLAGELAKSGWLPHDHDEGYREGYHHYSA